MHIFLCCFQNKNHLRTHIHRARDGVCERNHRKSRLRDTPTTAIFLKISNVKR